MNTSDTNDISLKSIRFIRVEAPAYYKNRSLQTEKVNTDRETKTCATIFYLVTCSCLVYF